MGVLKNCTAENLVCVIPKNRQVVIYQIYWELPGKTERFLKDKLSTL